MVLLKVGDRQLELRRANRVQGKFWITKEGVFELDGEYSYELVGQQLLFYNLFNAKPISLQGIERVQNLYREKKAALLVREVERINSALEASTGNLKVTDPILALAELYKGRIEHLTQNDMKYLIDHKIYDKDDLKLLNIAKMNSKNVDKGLSLKVPTILPSVLMMFIGITVVGLMSMINPLKWF